MKFIPAIAVLFLSVAVQAQSGFLTIQYDLNDSLNNQLIGPDRENIFHVIFNGYLNNQLNGYRFDIQEVVRQYGPLPPEEIPESYTKGRSYESGSIVTHHGKYYIFEDPNGFGETNHSPEDTAQWRRVEMNGPVVSNTFHFPTVNDTLSKKEFLNRMIMMQEDFLYWDAYTTYLPGDKVTYEGRNYMALQEHAGVRPTDASYWETSTAMQVMMGYLSDLKYMNVLYYYEAIQRDTVLHPQIVTLGYFRPAEYFAAPVISFRADELFSFLEKQTIPLAQSNRFGLLPGETFFAGDVEKRNLIDQVRSMLRTGSLAAAPKSEGVQKFLDGSSEQFFPNYELIKQPDNSYLLTGPSENPSKLTSDILGKFSRDQLRSILESPTATYTTFPQMVDKPMLRRRHTNIQEEIDSVAPLRFMSPVNFDTIPGKTMQVSYRVSPIQLEQKLFESALSKLWNQVQKKYNEGKLLLAPHTLRNPCRYDWSKIPLQIRENLQANLPDYAFAEPVYQQLDSLPSGISVPDFWIIYEFQESSKGKWTYEPKKFVFNVNINKELGMLFPFPFQWQAIAQELSSLKGRDIRRLRRMLKNKQYYWTQSNLVEGLWQAREGSPLR